jgi:hypothetical protein
MVLLIIFEEPREASKHLFRFEHFEHVTHNHISSCQSQIRGTFEKRFSQSADHLVIFTKIKRPQNRMTILISHEEWVLREQLEPLF